MSDDHCPQCGTSLECMGGCSAHSTNWYCPNLDMHNPRTAVARILELEAKLAAAEKDAAFYRCCALSGEIPATGSEPSAIDAARGDKMTDDDMPPITTIYKGRFVAIEKLEAEREKVRVLREAIREILPLVDGTVFGLLNCALATTEDEV